MEITAASVYDLKAYKALVHSGMSKKRNPKKQFVFMTIIIIAALVFVVLDMIFNGFSDRSWLYLLLIVFSLFLYNFSYFIIPRIHYKNSGKLMNINNNYTFTDDEIRMTSISMDFNATGSLKYYSIYQAVETHDYLFIYPQKGTAYIIDKSTISNGTIEDIKKAVSAAVPGKYIIYNY